MDWRILKEQRAADEAERIANASGDYGATGDFSAFPDPPPPEDKPFRPLAYSESESPFTSPSPQINQQAATRSLSGVVDPNAGNTYGDVFSRNMGTVAEAAGNVRPLGPVVPVTMKDVGHEALNTLDDVMSSVGTIRRYPARVLGNALAGEQAFKPDEAKGALADLLAPAYRIGGKLGIADPEHRPSLARQTMGESMEALKGAFDPNVSWGEGMRMGLGGLAGMAAEFGSVPGHLLPGVANPVESVAAKAAQGVERLGIPNPTMTQLASGLGRASQDILGVVRAAPPDANLFSELVRRGAVNMPGMPQVTPEQVARVLKLSRAEAKNVPASVRDDFMQDMRVAGIQHGAKIGTMDDASLVSLMKDYATKQRRMMEPRGVPLEKAEMVADPMRTPMQAEEGLGLSDEAAKEILAGAPAEAAVPEKVRKQTYAPRGESDADRAARASRVEDMLLEGGDQEEFATAVGMMDRKRVIELAKRFGDPERNAGKAEAILKDAFAAQQKEPKLSVATPEGRQEAAELQTADQAEQMASGTPVAPPSGTAMSPEGGMSRGEASQIPAEGGAQISAEVPAQGGRAAESWPAGATVPVEPAPGLGSGEQVTPVGAEPTPAAPAPSSGAGTRPTPRTEPSAGGIPAGPPRGPAERPPRISDQTPTFPPLPPSEAPASPIRSPASPRNKTGFADDIIDTLENTSRKSSNPAGTKLAESLREAINYGETNSARPVHELGRAMADAAGDARARTEVSELISPQAWRAAGATDLRLGKFQGYVDSDAAALGVLPEEVALTSPKAQAAAAAYTKAIAETGHEAENLGVLKKSGEPFVAKENVYIQSLDPSARAWMKDGNPIFDHLKDQYALINPEKDINQIGESLKAMASQPLDRPAAMEFDRDLILPAAIEFEGELHPILKYNPLPTARSGSSPAAEVVKQQWMRLGGIKHVGQDVTRAMIDETGNAGELLSQTPLGAALNADKTGNTTAAAEKALAAFYHRPEAGYTGADTSKWWINRSRDKFAQAVRGVFGRIVPALNLGMQGAKSATQTAVEVPAMVGAQNFAKAVAETISKYGAKSEEAAIAGALHEKFLLSGAKVWDQHRPLESLIGRWTNRFPTEKLNDFVKDFNDTLAFTAGEFKADEMLAKGSKLSDHLMMDEMNLPQSVQDVFRRPSAYSAEEIAAAKNSFARRVTQESQFHSRNAALRGRFENDAALRWVLPYQQYTINTLKRTAKDFERVWRTSGLGVDPNANFVTRTLQRMNPFGSGKEPFRNAVQKLLTRVVGAEAAGEVVADISSGASGNDPLRRDRSTLGRFLENLSYISFLGPAHFAFDIVASHVLGDEDSDLKGRMASGHGPSRAPGLSNPLVDAAMKGGQDLLRGDVGKAAYDVTVGQAPAIGAAGRATGLMEPAGAKRSGGGRNPFEGIGRPLGKRNAAPNPFGGIGRPLKASKAKNPFEGIGRPIR